MNDTSNQSTETELPFALLSELTPEYGGSWHPRCQQRGPNWEQVLRLRCNGYSINTIGRMLGISRQRVYQILVENAELQERQP